MASTKSTSKSRPKASNNNDGVGKVIEDLQDRFGKLREDLQADVSDFQQRARDHWDNFAGKFDAKELSKDRERLVEDLNKRTETFVKRLQKRLPGIGEMQKEMDKMQRKIHRLENELAKFKEGGPKSSRRASSRRSAASDEDPEDQG